MVKTIEVVRLENYKRLVTELLGDDAVRPVDIATALGISTVYAWQLQKGERDRIDSTAARKMERKAGKEVGWMDTDFSMWPLPDADLLGQLQGLEKDDRLEIQGAIRNALSNLQAKRAKKSSGKSSRSSPGAGRSKAA